MKTLIAITLLTLPGCALMEPAGPDKDGMNGVACSDNDPTNWSECERKLAEQCPGGYDVLSRQVEDLVETSLATVLLHRYEKTMTALCYLTPKSATAPQTVGPQRKQP